MLARPRTATPGVHSSWWRRLGDPFAEEMAWGDSTDPAHRARGGRAARQTGSHRNRRPPVPVPVVAEEFAGLRAIKIALFGSWAARYRGEPGPAPNDVDVLLVGDVDRDDAYEAARRAEHRLGFPVNPTLLTASRWEGGEDPLTRTIKSSALVDVLPTALDPAR